MTATVTTDLIEALVDLAIKAGEEILVVYDAGGGAVTKTDGSPVTEADTRAEAVILAGLAELTPEIPVLAEEKVAAGDIPDVTGGPFWLVDPLDGTKEFISRNGEFTVNIALVDNGEPVLGVVHLPALGSTYIGSRDGGAQRRDAEGVADLHVRAVPDDGYDVLTSRSHSDQATEDFLAKITVRDRVSAGSSLKFCRVAEGSADLYPRMGRTMEWDTAAGHAVVLAAGGVVCTLADEPLRYGKDGHDNPAFVAYGSARPPL
jgi:3'(2'), 5'-bisphosphate nucleotidase